VTPTAGSSTASDPLDSLPAFYFDLSSPECWLAAERVLRVVPPPCEWIPVAMPFEGGFRCVSEEEIFRGEIERAAAARDLQEVRWPEVFPFDSAFAQRAAMFAKGGGKTVGFALAAFRQAFAAGRDLSDPQNVMIAAAAVEIHPRALLIGADTAGTKRRLEEATAQARARGVRSVPAVWAGGEVFHGDESLEAAAAAVVAAAP
jgi:2-hydroxychromene-2-carboxylate isomerase